MGKIRQMRWEDGDPIGGKPMGWGPTYFVIGMRRVQKIKMSLTTPVTAPDDMFETVLDGVPNGEPGLTPNFYERVPYIPDSVVTLLDTATDATTDPVVVTDTVINQVDDHRAEICEHYQFSFPICMYTSQPWGNLGILEPPG